MLGRRLSLFLLLMLVIVFFSFIVSSIDKTVENRPLSNELSKTRTLSPTLTLDQEFPELVDADVPIDVIRRYKNSYNLFASLSNCITRESELYIVSTSNGLGGYVYFFDNSGDYIGSETTSDVPPFISDNLGIHVDEYTCEVIAEK